MTRSRTALVGAALAVAGALVFVPTAATGHTEFLYSWGLTGGGEAAPSAFLTVSKSDAGLSPLGDLPDSVELITGTEICGDAAFAVDGEAGTVITWDHATGAVISSVPIIASGYEEFTELDALEDCTLLTLAVVEEDDSWAILSLDPVTGVTAVEFELFVIEQEDAYYTGIATAPDGTTYVFGDITGTPFWSIVDLATDIQEIPTALAGLVEVTGGSTGFTAGIDFDAAGGLWFIHGINDIETLKLAVYAAGANIGVDEPTEIGITPYGPPAAPFVDFPTPLAVDHAVPAPAPQLAATGTELPAGVVLAAGILLLAGAALVLTRRRSAH